MSEEKNLCTVTGNLIVPEEVFIDGGAETLLAPLRDKLKEFVPDLSTKKSRAEIASFAAKFSKSKTLVDKLGKGLKERYTVKIKPIDQERRIFKEGCDDLRDKARQPLTDWENEQERIIEEERKRVEQELENERLAAEKALADREAEIERKEAELAKVEADRLAKEKAEQDEKDRLEYEAKVKAEAEAKAKKDAEDALLREQQEKERLIVEAKQKEEQAKIDAENAEKQRLQDIEDAKVKAEKEKQDALDEQKRQQQIKESNEAARLETIRRENERKAKNLNHQKAVNNRVLKKLIYCGASEELAKTIISDILSNPTNDISINY